MDFRLKKHRKQYVIVISYATSRNYCIPEPHVHGQEIIKHFFSFLTMNGAAGSLKMSSKFVLIAGTVVFSYGLLL